MNRIQPSFALVLLPALLVAGRGDDADTAPSTPAKAAADTSAEAPATQNQTRSDEAVPGTLPTRLGIVRTDSRTANATVTLSATSTCKSFQALHASATFGDGGVGAATAEDRCVGFASPVGIATLTLSMGVPLKADHLQFGW